MVERYKRSKGKKLLLDNHQKCWIWGRHAVLEILRAGNWDMHEVHVSDSIDTTTGDEARALAAGLGIPVLVEPADKLSTVCHSSEHQGLVAKMCPFPYADDAALRGAGAIRTLIILDGIQDPYNFGAIIRSCDVFGVDGILIGENGQAGVSSMVARSSAGAVAHLPVYRTVDLVATVRQLADDGVCVLATASDGEVILSACDFTVPTAIVIGNEGQGVSPEIRTVCSGSVSIPQCGSVGSLNAAQAAAIVCYESRRNDVGE